MIKDKEWKVPKSDESVLRRWKEYFKLLMNAEDQREERVEEVVTGTGS